MKDFYQNNIDSANEYRNVCFLTDKQVRDAMHLISVASMQVKRMDVYMY